MMTFEVNTFERLITMKTFCVYSLFTTDCRLASLQIFYVKYIGFLQPVKYVFYVYYPLYRKCVKKVPKKIKSIKLKKAF